MADARAQTTTAAASPLPWSPPAAPVPQARCAHTLPRRAQPLPTSPSAAAAGAPPQPRPAPRAPPHAPPRPERAPCAPRPRFSSPLFLLFSFPPVCCAFLRFAPSLPACPCLLPFLSSQRVNGRVCGQCLTWPAALPRPGAGRACPRLGPARVSAPARPDLGGRPGDSEPDLTTPTARSGGRCVGARAGAGGRMDGSAPPTPARPGLTQRAAMRVLHHPRQNNSDRQSLLSPAELRACRGPPWATEILLRKPGGCAVGVRNWTRTGGWNPSPGAGGPGRVPSGPRAQVLEFQKPLCACLTILSQSGLKPSSQDNKRAIEKCFPSAGLREVLDFGGAAEGRL